MTGLVSAGLVGGSILATTLIEWLLRHSGEGKDVEQLLTQKASEAEYAGKQAQSHLAATERIKSGLAGMQERVFGLSPTEVELLLSAAGNRGFGELAGTEEGTAQQIAALLDTAVEPGFAARVQAGSNVQPSPLARAYGYQIGVV